MTDWKALAAAAEPALPEGILDQVIPPLQALEAAFRPLLERIPLDGPMWSGPIPESRRDAE